MALPSFRMHKKFLTLVARLQIPEVYVRGHMEYLWESANATGDPVFSDEAMVEAAASWNGEPGAFCDALIGVRLLDKTPSGEYEIHDYWHHCPEYIAKRAAREAQRQARGDTVSSVRKLAGERGMRSRWGSLKCENQNESDNKRRKMAATCYKIITNGGPPTPTPTPTPREDQDQPPQSPPLGKNDIEQRFDAFWAEYPKRVGKGAARKSWAKIRPGEKMTQKIIESVKACKKTEQWKKERGQFIPMPATWLNQQRWEDDPDSFEQPDELKHCQNESEFEFGF